ncbi:MAG: hypothetical protein IMZ52_05155, partial [Actinobacteria bacterium]|nr:hypothetical protein [Actinomycetota bacterium]
VDMTDILNEKVDSNFLTYKIPVKIVYPNNNEEAIKIFNRVNTSGKKIDNVVIAFAYIKDKYPKIATEIINFQRRCIERGFDLSDRVLMNCFIVVNKIKETDWSPSTRRPDKLIIDYLTSCNRNIEKDWENTFSRVKDALSFLRRNAGYDSDQFLTADNIIISLTGYLEVNDLGHKISSQKRNYLRKWLYRTILLGRYSITSNYTQDLKDLNKKKRFYNSEKMTRLKFENEYKPEGIISLMYAMGILNKMKDYNSNLISWSISRNNSERIHVDHIYPRSKLTKEPILGEIEEDIYDDFGNKAFIMGDDNSSKNKKFLGDEILDSRISQWIDREKFLSETDYQNMLKDKKKLLESCREIEEFVYRRHKKIIKNIQNII